MFCLTKARKFAEVIFRKRWFEHEGVKDDGEGKEVITGIHNEHAYRTLARISMMQMLNYIGCPDALDNAEWKNYTCKPRPKEKPHKDNGEWKKVPAHMEDVFGKPYLTEEDWMISL